MVEESWTCKHELLYPPCNIDDFYIEDFSEKTGMMVTFAHFRKDKRMEMILDIWKGFMKRVGGKVDFQLKMIGAARCEADMGRVVMLKQRIIDEEIPNVEVLENRPFPIIMEYFKKASFGIQFARNETFGIGVVEMVAAGLFMFSHDSGGPKLDILRERNGKKFGILTEDDDAIDKFVEMYKTYSGPQGTKWYIKEAREGQDMVKSEFGTEAFNRKFLDFLEELESK